MCVVLFNKLNDPWIATIAFGMQMRTWRSQSQDKLARMSHELEVEKPGGIQSMFFSPQSPTVPHFVPNVRSQIGLA